MFVMAAYYLNEHDYGQLRKFFVPYDIISPILTLGIPAGIIYVINKSPNHTNILKKSIGIIGVTCAVYTFTFILFGNNYLKAYIVSNSFPISIAMIAIYAFAQSLQQIVQPFAISSNLSKMLAVNTLISSIALTIITWLILNNDSSVDNIILSRSLIILISASQIALTIALLSKSSDATKSDQSTLTIVRYCLPLGIASGINAISLGLDKLIVSLGTDASTYAIYANGAMEIPLIGVLIGSISTIILSEMVKRIDIGDKSGALRLFRLSGTTSSLIIFPAFFISFIYAETIISTLFSGKYMESANIFRTYLLVLPARIVVFGSAIIALGEGRKIVHRGIVELIANAAIGIVLFYTWGAYAVPFSIVLTTYFWSIPFNMRLIRTGFNAKYSEILDIATLSQVALICMMLTPILLAPHLIKNNSIIIDCIASIIYVIIIFMAYQKLNIFNKTGLFELMSTRMNLTRLRGDSK